MAMREASADETDEFVLRRMGLGDLTYVMDLHRIAFPSNVVGRLGSPLLKAYYRTFLDGPEVWARVATIRGEPAGYLVGVLDVVPYRRHRREDHGVALAWAGTRAVFRNPSLVAVLLLRRVHLLAGRIKRRHAGARRTEDSRRLAVLSHVAVGSQHRGQGIGGALVDDFVKAAQEAGVDAATLATLDGASEAGSFYERRDWMLVRRRVTADHRTIRIYELPLSVDAYPSRVAR